MNPRFRILSIVTRAPERGPRLAGSEDWGLPGLDPVVDAARLLAAGAEVRVVDQDTESISDRSARREARQWRADLVLLHAGGNSVADNPVPDDRPLRALLSGWRGSGPVVVAGPLARHFGRELLARHGRLAGALAAHPGPELVGAWNPSAVPGLLGRDGDGPPADGPPADRPLPAWHVLSLTACAARSPLGVLVLPVEAASRGVAGALEAVTHAVHRGGARRIAFLDRCFAADEQRARRITEGMLAAAPGVPWSCRVRADRVDPMLALTLANGGCRHVLLAAPAGADVPGAAPMDDPDRARIESAVESLRVVGVSVVVEFVVGRPGHTRAMLGAWQRWFRDRGIEVRAHVRVLPGGTGELGLEPARARAGCRDNELTPKDVERAVRELTAPERVTAELYGG